MSSGLLSRIQIPQDRYEFRLSGSGGQGMVLAAVILCEAIAGGADRRNVAQTQSYGPEARGGASKTDVVVSEHEIFYPKAMKLDLLLAMTQESLDKYFGDLKDGGTLIIDSTLVTEPPNVPHFALPFTRLAREEAGHVMVANVVALAAIAALTNIVTREALTEIVMQRAPRGTEDRNRTALEVGFREALKLKSAK